jgi:hypothetical protein
VRVARASSSVDGVMVGAGGRHGGRSSAVDGGSDPSRRDEPEARNRFEALSPPLREIAQRYIERPRLAPFLSASAGARAAGDEGARAVYFDGDSRPDDLIGTRRPPRRLGG